MSLFPIRLKPGGTLTVHLRLQVRIPLWVHRRDYLIDPHQNRKLCYERLLPFMPAADLSHHEKISVERSGQIFGCAGPKMPASTMKCSSSVSL